MFDDTIPPPPPGFVPETNGGFRPPRQAAPPPPPDGFVPELPKAPPASGPGPITYPTQPGVAPTGYNYDGDTFRLNTGRNARLFGVDAFERNQQGYDASGNPVPLGEWARSDLSRFATPDARVGFTGGNTYNRPVVTLDRNGQDVGGDLVSNGFALSEPQYLRGDQQRFFAYTQAEREARMNRRGAFGYNFMSPGEYRDSVGKGTSPFLTAPVRPQGNQTGAMYFGDQPTPFQGLKPEVEKQYVAIAKDPNSTPADMLAFARNNGFLISPDKVMQFYRERTKPGVQPNYTVSYSQAAPRVLTNPGDGQGGALVRGLGDPFNMLDEIGAAFDTAGTTKGRENVWNSKRRWADIFYNNAEQNRSILAYDAENYPKTRLGGQVVGSAIVPGLSTEGLFGRVLASEVEKGVPAFLARKTAERAVRNRLLIYGGAEGSAAGFGAGEGTWTDRLKNAGEGGIAGSALGLGLGTAIPATSAGLRKMLGNAEGVAPAVAGNAADIRLPDYLTLPQASPGFAFRQPDRLDLGFPGRGIGGISLDPQAPTGLKWRPPLSVDDITPQVSDWAKARGAGEMFHGSKRPDISEFDPYGTSGYGLFGTGTYLTDSPVIGAKYSGKGLRPGEDIGGRTLYSVAASVKNPIDMDAPANPAMWRDAWAHVLGEDVPELSPNATNEDYWRATEDHLSSLQIPHWEGAETMDSMVRALGGDGITHIGGGRIGKGPPHRVVIALDPEQTRITGSLPIGSMMQPRNPDWLNIGPGAGSPIDGPRPIGGSRLPLATNDRAPDYLNLGRGGAPMPGPAALPSRLPMSSGFDRPSIVSGPVAPRVVDRIDVNGGARPLLADSTAFQRLAAAQRINPADVMPIPSSRLAGVNDLDAVNAGRYDPLRAPDEFAGLQTRNLPAPNDNARTLPKRGPVDLVTFARNAGGLRDEGGELAWSGIDNTPRNVDFAPNENRFGKLIDPAHGLSYDQMAQRAYDAGYFPELNRPPSRDEFLSALTDTHSGANRRFLPEDMPEVDRFYSDRDQRYAVEAARDAGAPLTRDNSEPATLADMDRNAAPVEAYSEWGENAPDFAGNVNLNKLDSPQEIKRALSQVERVTGGFDAARRGRITQAETQSLADDLGLTPAQLLARRKGQAFNAEEALAARQILAKSGNELVNLAKRITSGNASDQEIAGWRAMLLRHAAIQEQVAGATAEAGRALGAFKMTADSRNARGDVLRSLIDAGGGRDGIEDAARAIVESSGDPAAMNKAASLLARGKWKDRGLELYYNFLLSGPRTHAVNITSNLITALAQVPEHTVAAGIGAIRKALPGQADTDRVLFSETGARTLGMIQGAMEGFKAFGRTMRTGETTDLMSKLEGVRERAIPGRLGAVISMPTRMLSAEDEFFKAIARRSELVGLAVRRANGEGLKGEALKARVADLVANTPEDMLASAGDYARYVTFQRPLPQGSISQQVSAMTQAHPALKLFLPFTRTPTNILKFAIERSPASPLLREWRADVAAGGARRDLALTRTLVGSSAMAMAVEAARSGLITGGGPADDSAKRLMIADGWQPYSIKVGDKYYSYQKLDPFSTTLGVAADMVDLQSAMTDKQREKVGSLLVASVLQNLNNKSWLQGLSNLSDAMSDPGRYGEKALEKMLAGMAVPAVVSQTEQAYDPFQRDAQSITDTIRSRVPGLSGDLPMRRDVLGQPVPQGNGGGVWTFSPVYDTQRRNDPLIADLLSSGARIDNPSRSIHIGKKPYELTPQEYDQYQAQSGNAFRSAGASMISSPGWSGLTPDARREAMENALKDTRRSVRGGMFAGQASPVPALPPPPPGFIPAPPPPPGFVPLR